LDATGTVVAIPKITSNAIGCVVGGQVSDFVLCFGEDARVLESESVRLSCSTLPDKSEPHCVEGAVSSPLAGVSILA
jgi:hypothetical protein